MYKTRYIKKEVKARLHSTLNKCEAEVKSLINTKSNHEFTVFPR